MSQIDVYQMILELKSAESCHLSQSYFDFVLCQYLLYLDFLSCPSLFSHDGGSNETVQEESIPVSSHGLVVPPND